MTGVPQPAPSVKDELRAIIAGLEHARRSLARDDLQEADELWPRLERCAREIATLDHTARKGLRPVMLALLDELERTIAAFGTKHGDLERKLRSASRSLAAGAAYRQTRVL